MRKANIQIINKKTGKENKALTHKFMKSINTYEKFEFQIIIKFVFHKIIRW